tara:strand:+ start:5870 stop:6055 length:186 start_codon:yes stop_codon:yes gene_type:complete
MSEVTYSIVKMYFDASKDLEVVVSGLTFGEAVEWCNDPASHKKGEWWHSYREEGKHGTVGE